MPGEKEAIGPLNYAAQPRWRGKGVTRLPVLLLAAGLLGLACWRWGPEIYQSVELEYWYRQCAHFAPSPDTPAFEALLKGSAMPVVLPPYLSTKDPHIGTALAGFSDWPGEPWDQYDISACAPLCLAKLMRGQQNWGRMLNTSASCVAFCGERISPHGQRRMMCVVINPANVNRIAFSRFIEVYLIAPPEKDFLRFCDRFSQLSRSGSGLIQQLVSAAAPNLRGAARPI